MEQLDCFAETERLYSGRRVSSYNHDALKPHLTESQEKVLNATRANFAEGEWFTSRDIELKTTLRICSISNRMTELWRLGYLVMDEIPQGGNRFRPFRLATREEFTAAKTRGGMEMK